MEMNRPGDLRLLVTRRANCLIRVCEPQKTNQLLTTLTSFFDFSVKVTGFVTFPLHHCFTSTILSTTQFSVQLENERMKRLD